MSEEDFIKTLKQEGNFIRRFYKGFEYFIIRPSYFRGVIKDKDTSIHLCGYVVIDKKSKYYISDDYSDYKINCHWGLTYAGEFKNLSVDFCIGFDCAHCDDINYLSPEMAWVGSEYRNVEYVDRECKSIIEQLTKED